MSIEIANAKPPARPEPDQGSGRRIRAGTNAALSLAGAVAILFAVNYLAMRHYARGDWTQAGIYTLSDKSVRALSTLEKEVQIYMLWSRGDQRFRDVNELLDRYLAASHRLKVELVDPDINADKVQLLYNRYGAKVHDMGDGKMAIEASVIVVSGENVKFVTSADFENFGDSMASGEEPGAGGETVSDYKAEQRLTSAILAVTAKEQLKICFTQGHGEWIFEGAGGRALGHVKDGLTQDGYKVEAIATAGAARIPAACSLVVVAGPTRALLDSEAALLDSYLSSSGKLVLLLDPIVDGERFAPTGLEQLVARHGVKLDNNIILETDPRRLISASPLIFLASEFTSHAAVKQLALPAQLGDEVKQQIGAVPCAFETARSLAVKEGATAIAEVLAHSSKDSWGESDVKTLTGGSAEPTKDQYDTAGPAALAMAAALPAKREGEKAGRLVVVGDSDFLREDYFVNAGLLNRDFWSGLVGWLTDRGDLISISQKNPEHVRLTLTDEDKSTIWLLVIGEVLAFIALGIVVWFRRRN